MSSIIISGYFGIERSGHLKQSSKGALRSLLGRGVAQFRQAALIFAAVRVCAQGRNPIALTTCMRTWVADLL
jgi:hypothetical protein